MSELQPPVDPQTNGGGGNPLAGAPAETAPAPPPKRQRRPSVRLGDIGDQHIYENQRRTKQNQWKFASKDPKSSKTRPLVTLGAITGEYQDPGEDKDAGNDNCHNLSNGNGLIGSWKPRVCSKSKRGVSGTKRIRSNWGVKMDEGDANNFDIDFDNENDDEDDQSLGFSMDNERDLNFDDDGGGGGKEIRVRVSDGPSGPSDTDARNWNNNNNYNSERNGVRVWLNQLGLGRYAPVFEVHEVDDEVLPLLTLEDLKDMGINAVGSRRKMFCSIQKLGKGFS